MEVLKPGARFADRYVILERVGEGGMGVVWSARDEKLGRTVAVKMLSPQRVGNKTARARLKREARAAAALDNPGIAQVYDVGETDDGGAYLVMELVRGKSVRVMPASSMKRSEALRIVREVARTLYAAHRVDLVHRDVKPDNMMIREDGRVVLLDFGIAKDVGQPKPKSSDDGVDSVVTGQGTMLGTPPYVAPEQIHGKGVGPASDQFALAVVAFGLLTGKRPWDAPTELGLLGQILMEPPFVASSLAPTLPKEVDAVFAQALAKEASKRFPHIVAFSDALETAVTGKEVKTPEPDAPPPPSAKEEELEQAEAPQKTPAPERTPAPEKTPPPSDALEVELSDTAPAPAPKAPPASQKFERPVWKFRESDEPPQRSTATLVLVGLLIAILAAAGGVWYGRQGAAPPAPPGTTGGAGK